MKISSFAVLAVSCMPLSGTAFSTSANRAPRSATALNARRRQNDGFDARVISTAAVAAGMMLSTHPALATVVDDAEAMPTTMAPVEVVIPDNAVMERLVESSPASSISASSLLSKGEEYLDFSMPSYGSSVGESATKPKAEAPSFSNPFGDLKAAITEAVQGEVESALKDDKAAQTTEEDSKKAEEVKRAEEKAAAEAKKAEEKAAAEAKREADRIAREEEKAAAEAKREADRIAREEEKAAREAEAEAKKAEKEARRQAELEKQRLAVERTNEIKAQKEAEAAAAPAPAPAPAPQPAAPPAVLVPEIKAPDIKLDIPEFRAPDVKLDMPDIKMPSFGLPKVEAPKIDTPKVDMPKVDAPKVEMPKVDIPKFDTSAMSNIKIPSIPGYNLDTSEDSEPIEPQEVRDDRAREARNAYKDADAAATEIEQKAKEARELANEKKKLAKAAKDEACKTHWGGKVLCIRPFNSGY